MALWTKAGVQTQGRVSQRKLRRPTTTWDLILGGDGGWRGSVGRKRAKDETAIEHERTQGVTVNCHHKNPEGK